VRGWVAEWWENLSYQGDFGEDCDDSGSWASGGFYRSSYRILFQNKEN
jgi:hypothetical protein